MFSLEQPLKVLQLHASPLRRFTSLTLVMIKRKKLSTDCLFSASSGTRPARATHRHRGRSPRWIHATGGRGLSADQTYWKAVESVLEDSEQLWGAREAEAQRTAPLHVNGTSGTHRRETLWLFISFYWDRISQTWWTLTPASSSWCRPPASSPRRASSWARAAAARAAGSRRPSSRRGSAPPPRSCCAASGGSTSRVSATVFRSSSRTPWRGGTRGRGTGWSWSTTASPRCGSTSPTEPPTRRWAKWRRCAPRWSTSAPCSSCWTSTTRWAPRFSPASCRPPCHKDTPPTWTPWQVHPCPPTHPTRAPTILSVRRSRSY